MTSSIFSPLLATLREAKVVLIVDHRPLGPWSLARDLAIFRKNGNVRKVSIARVESLAFQQPVL